MLEAGCERLESIFVCSWGLRSSVEGRAEPGVAPSNPVTSFDRLLSGLVAPEKALMSLSANGRSDRELRADSDFPRRAALSE
jgi:hypothetical protein